MLRALTARASKLLVVGATMPAKYDHHHQAARLHERANECRRLASLVRDQDERASYEKLAKAYDILASEEQLLAGQRHVEN